MRTRRSKAIIERYGVTLSPGLVAEGKIIDVLLACPKGRRQQWLRSLLMLGIKNRQENLTVIEKWTLPQGDLAPSKPLSIQLDRRVPEDTEILGLLEKLPLVRRSQALRSLMVIGILLSDAENHPHIERGIIDKTNRLSVAYEQEGFFVPATSESNSGNMDPEKSQKIIKCSGGKQETPSFFVQPVEKIKDNHPSGVALVETAAQLEFSVTKTEGSIDSAQSSDESLTCVNTLVSVPREGSLPLSFEPSHFEARTKDPAKTEKKPGLAKLRNLYE